MNIVRKPDEISAKLIPDQNPNRYRNRGEPWNKWQYAVESELGIRVRNWKRTLRRDQNRDKLWRLLAPVHRGMKLEDFSKILKN